jgi:hypothetical protein
MLLGADVIVTGLSPEICADAGHQFGPIDELVAATTRIQMCRLVSNVHQGSGSGRSLAHAVPSVNVLTTNKPFAP